MKPAEKYKILEQIGANKKRKFAHVFLTENKISGIKSILKTVQKTEDTAGAVDRNQSDHAAVQEAAIARYHHGRAARPDYR